MIIIAGRIRIQLEDRAAAIEAMSAMMAETVKEEGCVTYDFSADFQDDTLFHLFEEWESQEHLDAHFVAPHMATFQATLATLGDREADIYRYVASEKAPL